jgi:predicted O-methyltransferase YrrM
LRGVYDHYVAGVSQWDWAVSWPTARALDALCTGLRPTRILDLGSGFSTYTICNWARRTGAHPDVVSVDDSREWLDKTRDFLAADGLEATLLDVTDLSTLPDASFDLAFDDLGRIEVRAAMIDTLTRVMAPGGVVVLDDMNVRGYRAEVRAKLTSARWPLYSLRPSTIDAKGRFAMLTAAPAK